MVHVVEVNVALQKIWEAMVVPKKILALVEKETVIHM